MAHITNGVSLRDDNSARVESYLVEDRAGTERIACDIVKRVGAGDLIVLNGEVGAGKTTLVQMICAELGIEDQVTSPTFSLLHQYKTDELTVSHLDIYRLLPAGVEEAAEMVYEALDNQHLTFVEWPAQLTDHFVDQLKLVVDIRHAGSQNFDSDNQSRTIELSWR